MFKVKHFQGSYVSIKHQEEMGLSCGWLDTWVACLPYMLFLNVTPKLLWSFTTVANVFKIVWFILSTNPSPCGWYGVICVFSTCNNLYSSLISLPLNCFPWSGTIYLAGKMKKDFFQQFLHHCVLTLWLVLPMSLTI